MADLLSSTSFASLVNYQKSSPLARLFAHVEAKARISEALLALGLDPDLVFSPLREFQCVLAGQFVLSLLDPIGRETFKRIDLLCGHSRFGPLFEFLRITCHATVVRRLKRVPDFPSGSYHYAYLFKFPHSDTHIRVIRGVHELPQFLIPQYPATHLMNYIASDHVVIAYPTLTFSRLSIQVRSSIPATLVSSFTLGSRTQILPGIDCHGTTQLCGSALRWFNDPQAAAIGLEHIANTEYTVNGLVHWQLGGERCNVNCQSDKLIVGEDP